MTRIYLLRHAQPDYTHIYDRTRPLTAQGLADAKAAAALFADKQIDAIYSSPYKRSYDTVLPTALTLGKRIITDYRFREREKGAGGNRSRELYQKRWADFTFHEPGGECLLSVQQRNIRALGELLRLYRDRNVLIGTHGTALCTILQYYDPAFGCADFLRIIDYMPYLLELQFEGERLIGKVEHFYLQKAYHGEQTAKHPAIGKAVTLQIDRPMNSAHPQHPDMIYPVNYGYVPGVIAPDGEEQDAYLLGVDAPVQTYSGRVFAVIHRADDVEEKWVVVPEGVMLTHASIKAQTDFCEQYFKSEIIL